MSTATIPSPTPAPSRATPAASSPSFVSHAKLISALTLLSRITGMLPRIRHRHLFRRGSRLLGLHRRL